MTYRAPTRIGSLATSVALLAATLVAAALTTGQATAAAAGSSAAGPASYAAAGTCSTTALSGSKPVKSRSGKKLGTAKMFAATRGEDLGFCVRIKPIKPLRKITTQAFLPHKTYYPNGDRSSSGLVGGSGLWRYPFLVTGTILGPGSSMKATARIKVPGGPSGKAKLVGTLS